MSKHEPWIHDPLHFDVGKTSNQHGKPRTERQLAWDECSRRERGNRIRLGRDPAYKLDRWLDGFLSQFSEDEA